MSALAPAAGPQARALLAPRLRPTWSWDFRRGALHPAMSFTRATPGRCFDASGRLVTVAAGAPRFDHDPVTRAPLGYLAEMQSTNSLLYSAEFDNAYWTKQRGSVTADQAVAPDGMTAADKLAEDDTYGPHIVYRTLTLTSDTYYGYSIFAKAGTRDRLFISVNTTSGNAAGVMYALSGGTITEMKTGSTSGTIASTSIRPVGDGWYRCAMVAKVSGTTVNLEYGLSNAPTGLNTAWGEIGFAGDGASHLYIWGAQVDSAGVGVTSHIPTAGSTVIRHQDQLSIPLSSIGFDTTKGGVIAGTYRHHSRYPAAPGYANQLFYITTNPDVWQHSIQGLTHYASSSTMRSYMVSGGVDQYFISLGASAADFVRRRQAVSWSATRAGGAVDGGAFSGATGSYTFPATTPTTLYIAQYGDRSLNGTIESIAYWCGQRTDVFVQAVSR